MWCGIANGAEDVLIPEKYDYDEQKLINNIIASRKAGKKHHIIVNAEGIGHSEAMAKRIEAATGIETRATILGHMQRGGSPTCKDRVYASMMGADVYKRQSRLMRTRKTFFRSLKNLQAYCHLTIRLLRKLLKGNSVSARMPLNVQ